MLSSMVTSVVTFGFTMPGVSSYAVDASWFRPSSFEMKVRSFASLKITFSTGMWLLATSNEAGVQLPVDWYSCHCWSRLRCHSIAFSSVLRPVKAISEVFGTNVRIACGHSLSSVCNTGAASSRPSASRSR